MIFKDYYKILGLETSKVSSTELKLAFREQAKKYHPDVNQENYNAEERFKDINEAYRVLSNPSSKRKYDRMWNSNARKNHSKESYKESKREKGALFSDFFNMFFGTVKEEEEQPKKVKKLAVKGENIETEITVDIEDAFYGLNKKISLRSVDGKMKTFSVKVPAGIRNGEKIRLLGQGKSGKHGGTQGDLFIKINIKENSKFKLDGYDLVTDLYITPWEAALGKKVKVFSIDDSVSLFVPPGIQSGEKVRIPNKGYQDGKGGRGDLVAEIKTVVPKELTDEEKTLFKQLQDISSFNPRS